MSIALKLTGQEKDLGGGFLVRRLLPSLQRQSIGPFLFFDHFGPVTVVPGNQHDVRPHPHIGLATVTYMFEGAIMHRDSLGYAQEIEPGAINWMTAGRGIVHSERQPDALRDKTYVNHGIQLWAALPREFEETAPSFVHTPAAAIPSLQVNDATLRVLVGHAFDASSPVATFSETIYLDIKLPAGGSLTLPPLAPELAVYAVNANVEIDGDNIAAYTLAVLTPNQPALIKASSAQHLLVIGGAPLDGPRFIWWNYVASSKARIDQAADDWQNRRMGTVKDDPEFIPLPKR